MLSDESVQAVSEAWEPVAGEQISRTDAEETVTNVRLLIDVLRDAEYADETADEKHLVPQYLI